MIPTSHNRVGNTGRWASGSKRARRPATADESLDGRATERGEGWYLCGLLFLGAVWMGALVLIYLEAMAQ
jgi:hypothetical protein